MSLAQVVITLAHAVVGWALCGATMGIGLAKTTLKRALVIHAVAAPVIFGVIAAVYFTLFGYASPAVTATAFVAVVITLDFLVVALMIQGDFAMFRSVVGTWLPFALIFLSTYLVGSLAEVVWGS